MTNVGEQRTAPHMQASSRTRMRNACRKTLGKPGRHSCLRNCSHEELGLRSQAYRRLQLEKDAGDLQAAKPSDHEYRDRRAGESDAAVAAWNRGRRCIPARHARCLRSGIAS